MERALFENSQGQLVELDDEMQNKIMNDPDLQDAIKGKGRGCMETSGKASGDAASSKDAGKSKQPTPPPPLPTTKDIMKPNWSSLLFYLHSN